MLNSIGGWLLLAVNYRLMKAIAVVIVQPDSLCMAPLAINYWDTGGLVSSIYLQAATK